MKVLNFTMSVILCLSCASPSKLGSAKLIGVQYSNLSGVKGLVDIIGRVVDVETGMPIPSANVYIVGERLGAVSDRNGCY